MTNRDALKIMDMLPVLAGIEEKYNICPLVLFDARDRHELWPRCAKFGACEKCLQSWLTEEKYNAEK